MLEGIPFPKQSQHAEAGYGRGVAQRLAYLSQNKASAPIGQRRAMTEDEVRFRRPFPKTKPVLDVGVKRDETAAPKPEG